MSLPTIGVLWTPQKFNSHKTCRHLQKRTGSGVAPSYDILSRFFKYLLPERTADKSVSIVNKLEEKACV